MLLAISLSFSIILTFVALTFIVSFLYLLFSFLVKGGDSHEKSDIWFLFYIYLKTEKGFPGNSVGKESAYNAGYKGDAGSISGSGISLGGGKWQPIQKF